MFVEVTEGFGFSAAHFVAGHEKCEYLHGHNWRVGMTVEGDEDEHGLVVDFLDIKRMLEKICNAYDHRVLLPGKSPTLKISKEGESTNISVCGREYKFPSADVVLISAINTTVEEFARVIADDLVKSLSARPNVRKIKVLVEESPGQSAIEERPVKTD
ncbi:MAG: 6-carboxytetrahydropterin synthase [Methanobacteriota archaeon]